MSFKSEFMRAMDRKGIKYTDEDVFRVRVSYSGDNVDTIAVKVIFDEDGDGLVALRCWSLGKVPDNKRSAMVVVCNNLNKEYRWVKFYIDDDNDITAALDAVIDISTVGEVCIHLVNRMVGICDEAYPKLMKGLWS